jgi:hypothetical protein
MHGQKNINLNGSLSTSVCVTHFETRYRNWQQGALQTRSYCFVITALYVVGTAGHIWRQTGTGSVAKGLVTRRRSRVAVRSASVARPLLLETPLLKDW